jgi:hypothetical protein
MRRTLQHQKLMAQSQDLSMQGAASCEERKTRGGKLSKWGRDRLQGRTGKVNRLNQNGVFTMHRPPKSLKSR